MNLSWSHLPDPSLENQQSSDHDSCEKLRPSSHGRGKTSSGAPREACPRRTAATRPAWQLPGRLRPHGTASLDLTWSFPTEKQPWAGAGNRGSVFDTVAARHGTISQSPGEANQKTGKRKTWGMGDSERSAISRGI